MAKEFSFKLKTLLKVRKTEENRHKCIIAERLRRIQGLRDERSGLEIRIAEAIEDLRESASRSHLDVGYLARQRYWAGELQRRVLLSDSEVAEQERELHKERADFAEAAKAVRIVEKLRERQWAQHRETLERAERREADELAVLRFSHLKKKNG